MTVLASKLLSGREFQNLAYIWAGLNSLPIKQNVASISHQLLFSNSIAI